MVEIHVNYEGDLRNLARHTPSGTELVTDAPVDNHGLGQSFSPTDLLATALATCMTTIMGITAQRKNLDIKGIRVVTQKHMSTDQPRRITQLDLTFHMPLSHDHPERRLLEAVALGCPVHHSIHPDIHVNVQWNWQGQDEVAE